MRFESHIVLFNFAHFVFVNHPNNYVFSFLRAETTAKGGYELSRKLKYTVALLERYDNPNIVCKKIL